MKTPLLYLRTVRHLRLRQVCFRLLRRVRRPRLPSCHGPVSVRTGVSMCSPLSRAGKMADDFTFRFLNRELSFSPQMIDWHPRQADKLWRYNLHYFDYLWEKGRTEESIRILIGSWIAGNPPGTADAWEPFPLSLRIVNWIKYFLAYESDLPRTWLESLHDQALWLEQSIEHHLLANHYFKNGKALLFAGLFFSGRDAERWLKKGTGIVRAELSEQILTDGGHFERSPMYHAMILEDCLDLLNLCQKREESELVGLVGRLREVIPRMLRFICALAHPDGEIALFNDAAIGIEAPPKLLVAYWERLSGSRFACPSEPALAFRESGYFVLTPRAGDRLIVDCGDIGPSYQPGHAHCDLLSFELSLKGIRVVVDAGCGLYLAGESRSYQRGNAGHNTVTIDGRDQSEVWGAHRCARRAAPVSPTLLMLADGTLCFDGAHDGYRRLPGAPRHKRTVSWRDNAIRVLDTVSGSGRHLLESRLHLNPACEIMQEGSVVVVAAAGRPVARISRIDARPVVLRRGRYSPEFGLFIDCPVLVAVDSVCLPHLGGWLIETCSQSGVQH